MLIEIYWLNKRPALGPWPSARSGCAYTQLQNNVIIFHGGSEKQIVYNDMWELTIISMKDIKVRILLRSNFGKVETGDFFKFTGKRTYSESFSFNSLFW